MSLQARLDAFEAELRGAPCGLAERVAALDEVPKCELFVARADLTFADIAPNGSLWRRDCAGVLLADHPAGSPN